MSLTRSANSAEPDPVRRSPLATDVASMGQRIETLHGEIRRFEPAVERMACALYDPELDLLKTFVNSTLHGEPLTAYEYRLADSPALLQMARSRQHRVIDDIPAHFTGTPSPHTRWLLAQGFKSSCTLPLFVDDELQGFLFFDSTRHAVFTPHVAAQLAVYGRLVALMIREGSSAVRALLSSLRLAREFAHLRDVETGAHLERMSRYCRLIARGLSQSHGLSDEFVEQLFLFAPLHDIGKIGVPDALLRKEGGFNASERAQMRRHVEQGIVIVERLIADFDLTRLAGVAILHNIVAHHHELLDGSGYPRGLSGAQIPLESRIATVADIFDALSSRRVYKAKWSLAATFEHLGQMVDRGQIDGDCVRVLHDSPDAVASIMQRFPDQSPP